MRTARIFLTAVSWYYTGQKIDISTGTFWSHFWCSNNVIWNDTYKWVQFWGEKRGKNFMTNFPNSPKKLPENWNSWLRTAIYFYFIIRFSFFSVPSHIESWETTVNHYYLNSEHIWKRAKCQTFWVFHRLQVLMRACVKTNDDSVLSFYAYIDSLLWWKRGKKEIPSQKPGTSLFDEIKMIILHAALLCISMHS